MKKDKLYFKHHKNFADKLDTFEYMCNKLQLKQKYTRKMQLIPPMWTDKQEIIKYILSFFPYKRKVTK